MSLSLHQLIWLVACASLSASLSLVVARGGGKHFAEGSAGSQRLRDFSSRPGNYEAQSGDGDNVKHNRTTELGASRSHGGEYYGRHRWAYNFMLPLYRDPNNNALARDQDGYLTGFGLFVRNSTLIVHNQVLERASRVEGSQLVLKGWGEDSQSFSFFPWELDPQVSYWREFPLGYYPRMLANLGPNVSMVYLDYQGSPKNIRKVADVDLVPRPTTVTLHSYGFSLPELNSNVSLAENCYVLSFSFNRYTDEKVRRLSRVPVERLSCDGSVCLFEQYDPRNPIKNRIRFDGFICDTWHDIGAPVMCSEVKPAYEDPNFSHLKLSYMVLRPDNGSPGNNLHCYGTFYALRLADFYLDITRALTLGPPGYTNWPEGPSLEWT